MVYACQPLDFFVYTTDNRPMRWRRRQTDKVTAEVAVEVLVRDGGCVAALVFGEEGCRDMWGTPIRPEVKWHPPRRHRECFQIDHVKDQPRMGLRATSDPRHLQAVCAWHHLVWAGKKESRALARERLEGMYD